MHTVSSSQFTFNPKDKTLSACESDLAIPAQCEMNVVAIRSAHTQNVQVFKKVADIKSEEGELLYTTYKNPELELTVILFND